MDRALIWLIQHGRKKNYKQNQKNKSRGQSWENCENRACFFDFQHGRFCFLGYDFKRDLYPHAIMYGLRYSVYQQFMINMYLQWVAVFGKYLKLTKSWTLGTCSITLDLVKQVPDCSQLADCILNHGATGPK